MREVTRAGRSLSGAALLACLAACNGAKTTAGPPVSGSGLTPIPVVQGNGPSSPLAGRSVVVSGVVTGNFLEGTSGAHGDLGGFFVQGHDDGDPDTSDGVFVYDGDVFEANVGVGDVVRVTGIVTEHFGETQVVASQVQVTGTGSVEPTVLRLPAATVVRNSDGATIADLEHVEGMLVRLPQTLTVSDLRGLERFGEIQVSAGGRQFTYTSRHAPDVAGFAAHAQTAAAARIVLDDGRRGTNQTPVRYLERILRVGDEVAGLTGVLRYSRGSGGSGFEGWRLVPTENPVFEAANPRPGVPVVGGSLRVTSFNALNLFATIDSGQALCGPARSDSCRGADSAAELQRQLAKTVTTLGMIDADIAGLIELENDAGAAMQIIVDALNARFGAGTYAFLDTGHIGTGAIKTGFLFKPGTVTPVGDPAILGSAVDARFDDTRNRPALMQTFVQRGNGAMLSLVVNHLKSKGSACDDNGDPDVGDGQGNCSRTRAAAAAALVDWIALDPTGSHDPDVLILGDLNAYARESPLTTLAAGGFARLAAQEPDDAYSYVFDGQSGALDHALATASLLPQVAGFAEWHINADEPAALDYNLDGERDPDLFDATLPYRSSDHDPLVIGLDLR